MGGKKGKRGRVARAKKRNLRCRSIDESVVLVETGNF